MNKLAIALVCAALPALFATPAHALELVQAESKGGLMARALGGDQRAVLSGGNPKQLAYVINLIQKNQYPLPRCKATEGSVRIVEPDDGQALWGSYGLPMPTRMLRSFVTQSNCFRVLDRSTGFAAAQAERELASGGHLRANANMGGGQMLAADFILIPDIVGQNANAGGSNFGGSGRGLLGIGALGGGGNRSTQTKSATVMLSLVDTRTSEVLATASGEAEMKDVKWNVALGGSAPGVGSASVSAGAYENTEIGNVIRAAYQLAFHKMLLELEPMDLAARIQQAPEATVQTQVAQTTAYSTGGMATQSTAGMTAQTQLDMQNAQMAAYQQQMQQHQQMQQFQHQQAQQQHQLQQNVQAAQAMGATAGGGIVGQAAQALIGQAVPQMAGSQMVNNAVQGLQQGNLGQAVMQGAAQQLVGQVLPEGAAQMVGQAAQALQQGNLGQAVMQGAAQQLVGQVLPEGAAQMVGQAAQALQQGNLGQAVMQGAAQQLVGQALPAGTAQMVGQVAQGLQQGNLGQALVQGAVQQFAGTPAAAMGVLVLKVPANLLADSSGAGNPVRVLQPGETLARLGLNPQGTMIQVRDNQGVIGWIPASTHADLINVSQ